MKGFFSSKPYKTEQQTHSDLKPKLQDRPTMQLKIGSPHPAQISALQSVVGNQAVLQMFKLNGGGEAGTVQRSSSAGTQTRMPNAVQAKMEGALGADFSDVRIHANSSKATDAGALAYTQGTDVHFAPGQYNPAQPGGQRLLGHELAHVVQQKAGRVSPTAQLASGALLNDSPALEQEADKLGAKAANAPEPERLTIQRKEAGSRTDASLGSGGSHVIQRLPSPEEVKRELGEPKEHSKVFGKKVRKHSTHYRELLERLQHFDDYMVNNPLAETPNEINEQLNQVLNQYAMVERASQEYLEHNKNAKKDNKVIYIKKLKEMIPFERTAVLSAAAEYKADPSKGRPLWKLLTSTSLIHLSPEMSTGETNQGGINSVEFFEIGPGIEGVFKATKDRILSDQELPETATIEELDVAFSEAGVANHAKIDRKNARLANRNVAMSRLDQLLGAGVIAKAEFAIYNSGSGMVKGSYMEKAKGEAGKTVLPRLKEDIENGREESFDVNDPAFQRALSRLHLIDTLAMQVDRHTGNFYINRNDEGKTLGVTGIDNDMAFGTETNLDLRHNEYHGLSRFVDRELAERIISLKPDDLSVIMEGLLTVAEITALLERLHKLQAHLMKESTVLLGEDEWSRVDANARMDDRGYGGLLDKPLNAARERATQNRI